MSPLDCNPYDNLVVYLADPASQIRSPRWGLREQNSRPLLAGSDVQLQPNLLPRVARRLFSRHHEKL